MDLYIHVSLTPVSELYDVSELYENGVNCAECNTHLEEEAFNDGAGDFYCEPCINKLIDRTIPEAIRYAEEHCKITGKLPMYDSQYEYRCTPQDYASGARESYTPNAHQCRCRHHCTNYDELIRPLDRDAVYDRVFYSAIRERIDELLEEAISNMNASAQVEDQNLGLDNQ